MLGESLGFAMLVEWLRKVFGMAHVQNPMPLSAVGAPTAGRDDVHSADLAEARAQREDLESVLLAGPALEGGLA